LLHSPILTTDSGRRPIRVVHLITDLDIGGAEVMLARLVSRLNSTLIQNVVICLSSRGPVADRIERGGVEVFSLGMQAGRPSPFAMWELVRLLGRSRADILQTWLYHADLAGIVAGRLAGIRRIVWNIRCADLDPRDHPASLPVVRRALALASRWPSVVVCNSASGRQAHERLGYAPQHWAVIPNGFDVDVFRPSPSARFEVRRDLGLAPDVPLVGLLARLHPMKDHGTFLQAAKLASSIRPDVQFVAAGRGVDRSEVLASQVADLQLGERIRLLPEQVDAARFLAALDVAVSSSYGEAFPNVVGEAMACGTLCAATDVGESAAIVGDAGLVVPARNPERLAGGILELLGLDRESRATVSQRARQRILSKFSLDRIAGEYERLYEKLTPTDAIRSSR
jgi:glycosyltransferase involved in cell wall biosynthesis